MGKNLKGLLKTSLLLVVLLWVVSCAQNIGAPINKETLEFSFRSAQELNGSDITVTVTQNGAEPIVKKGKIENGAKGVTFSFGEFSAGSEVTATAVLTKDKVELFRGSKTVTIESGNNLIKLDLTRENIELTILPKLENSFENYRDSEFQVAINGAKPVTVKLGTPGGDSLTDPIKDIKLPLGYVKVGKPLTIDATIKNGNSVYYSYKGSYTPTGKEIDSTYELNNMVRNDGYVLWDNSPDSGKINVYYGGLDSQAVNNTAVMNTAKLFSISDFAVDKNGGVWFYDLSTGNIIYNAHGFNENAPGGFITYSIKGPSFPSLEASPAVIYMEAYDNGLLVLCNNSTFYKLNTSSSQNELVSTKITVTPLNIPEAVVDAFCVDGTSVYVTFGIKEVGETGPKPHCEIYKGRIANNTLTFDSTPLFNSSDAKYGFGADTSIMISDLYAEDGNLYALATDFQIESKYIDGSNYNMSKSSRGALIKIGLSNSETKIIGLYENASAGLGTDYINPKYMVPQSDVANYFVGPRKFVALKPKKLAIADAGACWKEVVEDPLSPENKKKDTELLKRVVTIDLETLAFESTAELDTTMFDGSVVKNCGYNLFIPR